MSGPSTCLFCFQGTYIHCHLSTHCIVLPYGVKNTPRPNVDKKALPECHSCPPSDLPILSHVKSCLPLIFLLKIPWQLFFSQALLSPPALTGTTDERHWSHSTVMERTSQLVATLRPFWQNSGGNKVLTNVEGTPSLSLKTKVKLGETQIKYSCCFKQSEHRYPLYLEVTLNI